MEDTSLSVKENSDDESVTSVTYLHNVIFNLQGRLDEATKSIESLKEQVSKLHDQVSHLHSFVEDVQSTAEDALSRTN